MKLLQIPPDITDQVWGAVAPFLERAVAHSRGTNSVDSARARTKTGHAQLWAIIEDEKPHKVVAAGLTSLVDYPTGKRAMLIELLGGESMQMWADLKPDLEKWAKQNGCALVFCWARKGWLRKLTDMRVTHYVMTKEI
jgi:hypothetical protein